MSILIKGMEKPKSCYNHCFEAFIANKEIGCPLNNYIESHQYKSRTHPDCPLIEIPTPHGRMIDADALFEAMGLDTVKEVMLRNWKFTTAWGVPIIETEEK